MLRDPVADRCGSRSGRAEHSRGRVAALRDAAPEDMRLAPQAPHGQLQLDLQFVQIGAAEVAEFDVLEIVPDALVRVEVRRVAGQLLQVEAGGGPLSEEVLDRPGAVDGRPIPEHQELPGEVPQQVLQEADHRGAPERLPALLDQQPPGVGQATDHGEMIPGAGHAQDGRPAPRGVGAYQPGQQIEPGLVYPDEGTPLASGFA
jgi:hypothetical protein